ncbi:MAG TPA: GNAT family N-acetyltransferase [Polyangiaceae bacterium]
MHSDFTIRPARPGDEHGIFALVQALAEYEHLSHAVTGNAQKLAHDLFGPRPAVEALVVEGAPAREAHALEAAPTLVAFALFFGNYSTFLTQPGLYLEDIFVLPAERRRGIGKALLQAVARLACDRNCGRLEWSVLDWNASAIAFYKNLGASVLPDWRICRVTAASLAALASPL